MTNRDQEQIARVAKMDWDELEGSLASSATRAGAKTEDDQALEKFFGPEELEELKRIAVQTRAMRTRAPLLGNVVLLPGIMGSNLVATAAGDADLIWVHLFRLIGGGIKRLRLSPDGLSDVGGGPVHASEVEKRTYTKSVLKLGGRWRVHPFPYDWRRNIDTASDALGAFVRNLRVRFPGEPINLVAHSLGGLVSRNFIRLHGDLWEDIGGDNTGRGGRLVMLGTPNYGSFAIHQAMAGIEKLVRWLEKADLKHDMREVLEILNSFVGSYQLLPAPGKIPAEVREIYKAGSWGMLPISQAHLDTAQEFHRNLESNETTIDPRRMIYVAGCNQETLLSLIIQGPGEFRYVTTHQGDGRVPFTLGLLKDVPTYYVEEGHGSLPKNDSVLKAVDQLLERGRTDALPDKPIPPRAFFVPEAPWHRSVGEYLIESALEKIAQQAEVERADSDEVRFAEEMLTRAAAGDNRPARQPGQRRTATARPVSAGPRNPLTVEVVHGDVRQVAAPVVVVGSYKGLVPVSAIGAIDQALDYWISQAMQQSMLGAELGQVFFIPIRRKQIAAGSVLVAGMGEEGKFSRHDLRYLMLNVTYAISALEAGSFATVLLGTGDGGLSLETAVRSLLFGVCDALARVENGIERLTIVEYDGPRAEKIAGILETVKNEDSAGSLEIRIARKTLKQEKTWVEPERPTDLPRTEFGTRITIERDGDVFRFSALTPDAVVPVREVDIQSFYSEGIAERLMKAVLRDEQEMYGRLLSTGLIPRELQEHYREPLTLIVDRSTAGFPWEMACYDRPEGLAFFGTHLGLTRQFRTMLSSSNTGIAPRFDRRLRVLVIADPAPEPELQLPGARREGQEVVNLLRLIKQEEKLDIEVIGRIGHEECDPIEILGLVLDGTFDVIHFAGHGIYDLERPNRSGWVFGVGKDGRTLKTLSAREIFLARRVPRLVFSNACFSAVVTQGRLSAEDMNRRLAGLAEAFFERGVPNYIGAGWPVQDDLAVTFATEFYARALAGQSAAQYSMVQSASRDSKDVEPQVLWQAVAAARSLIAHDGSTWGAYHHYGQADARLLPTRRAARPAPAAGAEPGTKAKASAKKKTLAGRKPRSPRKPGGKAR